MDKYSINNSIRVNDYDIVDDLELIDEHVTVQIVDAMFTSTVPDWSVDDPTSPYYIKNKPTNTSQFVNDGEDGTSKYVTYANLADQVKVADVQVRTSNRYNSVVVDKIAQIDLSPYVQKEFKTGSSNVYKVLSDNNYTDTDKNKVNIIRIDGDGNSALTNNGTYKSLYNILSVNGITPDQNKNITITSNNISYGQDTIQNTLDKAVYYKSASDKQIVLGNTLGLLGNTNAGGEINLIHINAQDIINVGSGSVRLNLNSLERPTINSAGTSQNMAFLSDISEHNSSPEAHSDIRALIRSLSNSSVSQITNAEMEAAVVSGGIENGQLVVPVDTSNYTAGKIYRFVQGIPNQWILMSNWQIENIYSSIPPTTSTVGVINQIYIDFTAKRTYRCSAVNSGVYTWDDITPEMPDVTQQLGSIINNTTLISDSNGGFTAGNNYRLLDSSGKIPIDRLPSAVIGGITYGGAFDGQGIITASSYTSEINGQNISEIDKTFYKNYYFYCEDTYTLEGTEFLKGDFALSSGEEWVKLDNQGGVISVNGKTGNVVLTYTDVSALPNTTKYGATLTVSGTTLNLVDQDNNILSTVTTQDTTYGNATSTSDGLMSSGDYVAVQEMYNNMPTVIEL